MLFSLRWIHREEEDAQTEALGISRGGDKERESGKNSDNVGIISDSGTKMLFNLMFLLLSLLLPLPLSSDYGEAKEMENAFGHSVRKCFRRLIISGATVGLRWCLMCVSFDSLR